MCGSWLPERRVCGLLALLAGACAPTPAPVSAPPAARATDTQLGPVAASASVPPASVSHLELVFSGACKDSPRVDEVDAGTLLITLKSVRLLAPGQPLALAEDLSAGLPAERGYASVFSRAPLVLDVEKYLAAEGFQRSSSDDGFYRLVDRHWVLIKEGLGEIPSALPVATGTVVVGWTDERAQHHGDWDMVPAGNMTRAWFISLVGDISELPSWPAMMTWQQQSSAHTLWAIAAKPGQGGHFLLRLPVGGKAALYAIPGTARCVGIDRLSAIPSLESVTDDGAELSVSRFDDCTLKKLAGSYHFRGGRFIAAEEPEEPEPAEPNGASDARELVRAGGAVFALRADTVLVTRNGVVESSALPGVEPSRGPNSPRHAYLSATAGGREVWLRSMSEQGCTLYRYQWPSSQGAPGQGSLAKP